LKHFHLYRFQIFARQMDFFESPPRPQEILKAMIEEAPRRELKTRVWLIGDFQKIEDSIVYFNFGRTSRITVPKYEDGHFVDTSDDATPYTEVFVDYETEVCAISRNAKVAGSVDGIARQLKAVLSKSEIVSRFNVEFYIEPIKDPEDFISKIYGNVQILNFYFTVRKPNVFDVSDFTGPLKELTKQMNGSQSKVLVSGLALDNKGAVDLAREAAATGQDAGALYRKPRSKGLNKSSLKKNPVFVKVNQEEVDENKTGVARRLMMKYREIRRGTKE
jgi:hypothetical protein